MPTVLCWPTNCASSRNTPDIAVAAIMCHLRSCRRSELAATTSIMSAPAPGGIAASQPTVVIGSPVSLSTVGSQKVTPHSAIRAAKL